MKSKMKEVLVVRRFAQHKNEIQPFVEAMLLAAKGNRAAVTMTLLELLEQSDIARRQIAFECVERIYSEMREKKKAERDAKRATQQWQGGPSAPQNTWHIRHKNRAALEDAVHTWSDDKLKKFESVDGNLESVQRNLRPVLEKLIPGGELSLWQRHDWMSAQRSLHEIWLTRCSQAGWRETHRKLQQIEEKASNFDRMVMALDAIQIGGKLLGDCTGGDLLREAAKLETIANEITVQSTFYRELAKITGKTTTVREAADRAGIVGLLTNRYQAAA